MNKTLSHWLPWIVLAVAVVAALLFADFDGQFDGVKPAQSEIEDFIEEEESLFDIDSDEKFDVQVDESEDEFVE